MTPTAPRSYLPKLALFILGCHNDASFSHDIEIHLRLFVSPTPERDIGLCLESVHGEERRMLAQCCHSPYMVDCKGRVGDCQGKAGPQSCREDSLCPGLHHCPNSKTPPPSPCPKAEHSSCLPCAVAGTGEEQRSLGCDTQELNSQGSAGEPKPFPAG